MLDYLDNPAVAAMLEDFLVGVGAGALLVAGLGSMLHAALRLHTPPPARGVEPNWDKEARLDFHVETRRYLERRAEKSRTG